MYTFIYILDTKYSFPSWLSSYSIPHPVPPPYLI